MIPTGNLHLQLQLHMHMHLHLHPSMGALTLAASLRGAGTSRQLAVMVTQGGEGQLDMLHLSSYDYFGLSA